MTNKHLAATFIGALVLLIAWGTMQMHQKLGLKGEEAETARHQAQQTKYTREMKQQAVATAERNTKARRAYLAEWLKAAVGTKTNTREAAKASLDGTLRDNSILVLNFKPSPQAVNNASLITGVYGESLSIEHDFLQTLNWMGRLESGLPTSRIESCKIKKGEQLDRIRMEVSVQFPLIATTDK